MKTVIDRKPGCEVDVKVEFPPETVNAEWERILGEFCLYAKLPGFRPGKAPKNVVERKFKKEIREELTRDLIGRGIRSVIKEQDLNVLRLSKVDDIVIADDQTLTFSTTIVTAPQFDLSQYKGLTLKVPPTSVCDHEVDEYLEHLRSQFAEYPEVEARPLAIEDYAVLNYTATCNGKPLAETAPEAGKFFGENKDFWLRIVQDAFLPGFVDAILGMNVGDSRTFEIAIAEDFPREDMRGLTLQYSVTLKSLRTQRLPELTDEFASQVSKGKTLTSLREEIFKDLQHYKERKQREAANQAAIEQITSQVEFELPAAIVKEERRRILEELVNTNRERGVSDDEIAEHKDDLIKGAERAALSKIKTRFILLKIAEAEKITATDKDVDSQILMMAYRWRMKPNQLRKELEKKDAIPGIEEDIIVSKALDFVVEQATLQVDESLADHQHNEDDDHAH